MLAAAEILGERSLRRLATGISQQMPEQELLAEFDPAQVLAAADVLYAYQPTMVPPAVAAAYLQGIAAGYARRAEGMRAELVWTGPKSFDVPIRTTEVVLLDLIGQARRELILTTYSARPYLPLLDALRSAVGRGVTVWIVVETLHGAGSAMQGDQPAKAFAGLQGVELWSWDVHRRSEGAKMHAKIAVADERLLLVTSANLTTSGISANMEAGVLINGGSAPKRASEHLRALRRDGILIRIT